MEHATLFLVKHNSIFGRDITTEKFFFFPFTDVLSLISFS